MARGTLTQRISLRRSYLIAAAIASSFLIAGAFFANWYISTINQDSSTTLELRNKITLSIQSLKNHSITANNLLYTMLVSTTADNSSLILTELEQMHVILHQMIDNTRLPGSAFRLQIEELERKYYNLKGYYTSLLENRKDPNWVYPALPYINQKLLEPNNIFETESLLAMQEITADDNKPYGSAVYLKFAEVRDLWRVKILNFRAILIRVAGLNNTETLPQELNIDALHQEITKKLNELQQLNDQGELNLQAEDSLEKMQLASEAWQLNWLEFKKLRDSTHWRGDIKYLNKYVQPTLLEFNDALFETESLLNKWSIQSVDLITNASKQINTGLWILAILALLFVILVYLMIDYSALRPISKIASSITSGGQNTHYQVDRKSSKEIHQLVDAFNNMRRQIHQRQIALEHQALHDSLTGLPNRSRLNDRLEQSISIMKRNNKKMALLILDLDRFKEVNDTLGHQVGDLLLQNVAHRLEIISRDSDTIARLGGDEFAIIAPNTDEEQSQKFARKIIESVNEVFEIEKQHLYVGVSIGVAIYPDNGSDISTLTRHADIAMYDAKRNNRGYSLYDATHDSTDANQLSLVGHLHDELNNARNLQVFYQPQVDLFNREIIGVEALLRWNHPELGFVQPEQIINLAEHAGQIGELTRWVLTTAISEYRQQSLDQKNFKLSINLSAWNLQDPELPEIIQSTLNEHQMPAEMLKLEVTESAMMNDPVRARNVMDELNKMNIQLSVDDYGTGFSSLGYLKLLPVQELKIDKSFVLEMMQDENDAIIVHSTIELAHNLGLKVVAEGVENQESLLKLRSLKCDFAQGFYLSKPVPMNELLQWLKSYKAIAVN